MESGRKKLFEFFYLCELTVNRIKPLSRIEYPLDQKSNSWLKHKGLITEIIPRKTLNGKIIYETIFSISSRYIEFYQKSFYKTRLDIAGSSQKLEGFLFGYPSCCVNQFIKKPYARNSLSKIEQSYLFHWACKNCRVTPELIPYYLAIYKTTEEWFNHHIILNHSENTSKTFPKIIQYAAAILLFTTRLTFAQNEKDTTHYFPISNDNNLNGLTYTEEIYLGAYDHGNYQSSHAYARFYKTIIDSLPAYQSGQTYKEDHLARGIITCPKCGLLVNMGFVKIVNPKRELQIDIPYIGLHFMECGHFSYGEDYNNQRINIDLLKKILFPYDTEHMISVHGDSDGDGLTDTEEESLRNISHELNDSNNDGVPDGPQLAEEIIRLFPNLKTIDTIHSSIKYFPLRGLENCKICGSTHNMGYIEITNPESGKTFELPYLSLHYLANGSFSYDGDVHQIGRINPVELMRTIKTHTLFIEDDFDNDGLKNIEEEYFNMNQNNIDSNGNGITDAKELALKFVDKIKLLPKEPRTDGPYTEYIGFRGIYFCSVCGKTINMGITKIFNPMINGEYELSNYAFHFLENGSFEYEGHPDEAAGKRIDPIILSAYTNYDITGIDNWQSENLPTQPMLEQNYPNPFNPITNIKYVIPYVDRKDISNKEISLKIFDLRGKEVAVLVNEHQRPGIYNIQFNGSKLPSGVYFCKLQVGNFKTVKKLLLIK